MPEEITNSPIQIGTILRVPTSLVESEFIKIIGDQRGCNPNPEKINEKWQLLAVEFCPITRKTIGQRFGVTEEECLEWLNS